MEYREIFLTLLRKYDETTQPQSYLKDLVESTHLFLRMLEYFCKGRKNLVVQVGSFANLVVFGNSFHLYLHKVICHRKTIFCISVTYPRCLK